MLDAAGNRGVFALLPPSTSRRVRSQDEQFARKVPKRISVLDVVHAVKPDHNLPWRDRRASPDADAEHFSFQMSRQEAVADAVLYSDFPRRAYQPVVEIGLPLETYFVSTAEDEAGLAFRSWANSNSYTCRRREYLRAANWFRQIAAANIRDEDRRTARLDVLDEFHLSSADSDPDFFRPLWMAAPD